MRNRKAGFTLIELMVVLAIITIISSITLGAFRSVTDGNKRTSCQSNLGQIYKSVRLYSQDFDGKYPYLNPVENPNDVPTATIAATGYVADVDTTMGAIANTPAGGIGLWSLYTFRLASNAINEEICPNNDVNLPVADEGIQTGLTGYVRSAKIFHCPADRFKKVVQYRPLAGGASASCAATTAPVNNNQLTFKDGADTRFNPAYLSYQTNDDSLPSPAAPTVNPRMTYSSFRREETVMGVQTRIRQLTAFDMTAGVTSVVERPTDQATVITWCRFHRSLDDDGKSIPGKRNFDNVLFSDGSVQSLPMEQDVTGTSGASNKCTGWQRVRRERADKMTNASTCTP